MSIVLSLVVLIALIGVVCYTNRCTMQHTDHSRSLPKEISDRL